MEGREAIMNITRHNYEEYFILYLDNELGSDERRKVEIFVQENPDLKQELDWLLQTRVVPEASIVFDGKEALLKNAADVINETNYEEWLLLYIDNELTSEQKAIADKLIVKYPAIKTELEILQKTKLQPEQQIVFKNKEILYHREEKVRVINLYWRRIAVAAVLLLTVSTAIFLTLNSNDDANTPVAEEKEIKTVTPVVDKPKNESINPINSVVAKNDETTNKGEAVSKEESDKNRAPVEKNSADNILAKKEKEAPIAYNVVEGTNNLPQPDKNPNVNSEIKRENPVAQLDPIEKKDLTNLKEDNLIAAVTSDANQRLDNVRPTEIRESVDPIDTEQPGKKNKLRGFFRKVTRTIEKRTNIKATDDEDRLLLAGFAVKL